MFCPNCKTEYRAGFDTCADCGSKLVDELPAEETEYDYLELCTIAETINPGLVALAKAMLDSVEIKYYINNTLQNYIPGCSLFTEIRVPVEDATNAKELLKEIGL